MVIPLDRDNPVLVANYADILRAFPHATFENVDGVYRFTQKPVMRWLCDHVDLNRMRIDFEISHPFSLAEYMQFYQDIGFSICGFMDVFHDELNAMMEVAP